ncbi:MAG: TIGR00153 family protein [Chlamydiota bacterium]
MLSLLKLFGKSPFAPLQIHMEKVAYCVSKLEDIFQALFAGDQPRVLALAEEISASEHEADQTKSYIRNHLTRGLFFLMDRSDLLTILSLQDSIADKTENIALLLTMRPIALPPDFHEDFFALLRKNLATFKEAFQIMQELDELVETSFGGNEAEKVKKMTEKVALLEHESDLVERALLRRFFTEAEQLPSPVFHLWLKIFESVGDLSNLSENLADRIRMLLEVK